MFNLGPMELGVILVLALLVFGPKKLPEIGKGVGQAMREFKRASRDLMDSFNEAMEERPRPVTDSYTSPIAGADSTYPAHPPTGTTPIEEPVPSQAETHPHEAQPPAAADAHPGPESAPAATPAAAEPSPVMVAASAEPGQNTAHAPERTT